MGYNDIAGKAATVEEVAKQLNLDADWLSEEVLAGRMPGFRSGDGEIRSSCQRIRNEILRRLDPKPTDGLLKAGES